MRETDDGADPPALVLRALRKTFARAAVDGLDLNVRAGELYALLGPNGAGKTTTLRMVAGLLPADSGAIEVFGVDARRRPIEAKRLIAWLPDEPLLYDKLDPLEYLEFIAGLWGAEPRRAQKLADEPTGDRVGGDVERHEQERDQSREPPQRQRAEHRR